jgi:hypothetical protein
MAARAERRLGWMLGALALGLAAGASLTTSLVTVPAPVWTCSGAPLEATVARDVLEAWLDAPPQLVTPVERPGRVTIHGLEPGSGLGSIGFRNGDTIRRVSGALSPMQLYARLHAGGAVTVEITRHGCPVTLAIHVVEVKAP